MMIEGAIAVKSAIRNRKRDIEYIVIDKDKKTKDFNYIRKISRESNIEIRESSKDDLSAMLSGKSHGGVGAEVSMRRDDELSDGDIFFLDGIEDPFNLGYAMRTLYAFGFMNVLLSARDYSGMQSQLLKSSAGAYDMLNVKIVEDEIKETRDLKEKGYRTYALYRSDDAGDIFDTEFEERSLIILGGEKRGISANLLELCDEKLFISYGSDFRNALNASGALDVTATVLYMQRRKK